MGRPVFVNKDRAVVVAGKTLDFTTFWESRAFKVALVAPGETDLSGLISNGKTLLPTDVPISTGKGPSPAILPTLTLGSQPFVANAAGQYIVDGNVLTPAGSINVSGEVTFHDSSVFVLAMRKTTQTFPRDFSLSNFTIGQQIFPAKSAVIHGQTLIFLATSTSKVVEGTTQKHFSPSFLPILTIGSHIYTANSISQYIIKSQILTPGGTITVSGTVISLAPSISNLIISGSTDTLSFTIGLGG